MPSLTLRQIITIWDVVDLVGLYISILKVRGLAGKATQTEQYPVHR